MTTYTHHAPQTMGWLSRTENWLDSKGKGAWIASMILGFILFWPIGLALLAYMIWGKGLFSSSKTIEVLPANHRKSSGNAAFDSYKADTLRRLEEEQEQFEAFLERLRASKDQAQFDQFMNDREQKNTAPLGNN